jgi:hypothetical protein
MGSPIELRETMFGTGDKFYTNDALNVIAFGLSNNRRDRQTLSRQLLRLCSRNWWRGPKDQAKNSDLLSLYGRAWLFAGPDWWEPGARKSIREWASPVHRASWISDVGIAV